MNNVWIQIEQWSQSGWGRWLRWLLWIGSGVWSAWSFYPWKGQFIWSWFSLVPFLILIFHFPFASFQIGYAWGLGFFITSLWWLNTVYLGIPCLLALVLAFYPAGWAWLVIKWCEMMFFPKGLSTIKNYRLMQQWSPSWFEGIVLSFILSVGWVGLEWLRSELFSGFPWNLLGVALWSSPLLQWASYGGIFLVSWLVAMINICVWGLLWSWEKRIEKIRELGRVNITIRVLLRSLLDSFFWVFQGGFWISVAYIGVCLIFPLESFSPREEKLVIAVQPDFPVGIHYTEDSMLEMFGTLVELTSKGVSSCPRMPDLVIWPESVLPWPIFAPHPTREGKLFNPLKEFIQEVKVPFLIGATEWVPIQEKKYQFYNSAVLINAKGERIRTYDKIHLVPFGEYVPFREYWLDYILTLFPSRLQKLLAYSLVAGEKPIVFRVDDWQFGVTICYEDAFPYIARSFALQGVSVLITITNDGWYHRSIGSFQHLIQAIPRAIENGLPLVRVGNNADSCLILPTGRISQNWAPPGSPESFGRRVFIFRVPIFEKLSKTFYLTYGEWIHAGWTFLSLCFILVPIVWKLQIRYKFYHELRKQKV